MEMRPDESERASASAPLHDSRPRPFWRRLDLSALRWAIGFLLMVLAMWLMTPVGTQR
jgi:ferric-dicitrate binding protein FerR (iron transport regulator)